jgi:tetratricopeptide (TPR) repeat protein
MDYDRLRELQQKYDENPRRYFAPLANEYRKGGQLKRAIDLCRAQLAEMPGHMSGQIVFGQALYESGEFEEARQVFERAISLDPENLIALRSLGDMSLQAGDTVQARSWYTRLLEADPKDTAVIALVTEIDAASEAAPVAMSEEIPGVDSDAGDQEIPVLQLEAAPASAEEQHPVSASTESRAPEPTAAPTISESAQPAPEPEIAAVEPAAAPEGLERHYPIDEGSTARESVEPLPPPALTREELGVPIGNSAAEGLRSMKEDVNAFVWTPAPEAPPAEPPLVSKRVPHRAEPAHRPEAAAPPKAVAPPEPVAPPKTVAPPEPEPAAPPAPVSVPVPQMNSYSASAESARDEKTVEEPVAAEPAKQAAPSPSAEKTFSGASAEPFVNETMAQLYLQQGYKQLALKVYRQLAESRPNDASLRNRIAEIEAEDAAAHPGEVPSSRKEGPSVETPADHPPARSPSIESPTPASSPGPEENPRFDQSPIDSPPAREPSRERESVEIPARDEPRAEPEGLSARQPSIREFFATLGRRRPPRTPPAPSGGMSYGGGNNQPVDTTIPLGATPASASLDTVFAGATVSQSDARAASRLAGAFSGASGASRTPPTPPMPTPRLNPRVPAAQESEEDVAKFRAWLDGLTGE